MLSLKLSPLKGKTGHIVAHSDTFHGGDNGGANNAETLVNKGEKNGAGHGDRTRDIQLGKLALYQLS